ncbi:phage minor head protein [Petroclostridium sp. X23]|uniref:phage head morphogenesis protein n=1 Tax=Petroclostridium sp. X23 TaxID=3045146 RepID=UPI0024AE3F1B|nr:phage minor head protein [Petroclostridium sp. X23]WHH59158.1 phage minor head protein [Petroclostridium sp. X23]
MINKKILTAIQKALDTAIEKADDTKEWVGKIPQSKAWTEQSIKAINSMEKQAFKLLKKQRDRYIKALGKIKLKVKKADFDEELSAELAAIIEEYETLYEQQVTPHYINIAEIVANELLAQANKAKNINITFDLLNEIARDWLEGKRINFAKEVSETTHKAVIEALTEGFEAGEGISKLAARIKGFPEFGISRAITIARTEIISASNAGSIEGYRQSGVVIGKEWLATADGKTRRTHAAANGQRKKLDSPFIVGGYKLMQPGDGSLGAPAKEIVLCRCTVVPILEGEKI